MQKKILIVDDEASIVEAISLVLEDAFEVASTPRGDHALAKAKSFKPDLILLDLLLSGSDGRSICKDLKKDTVTKAIPIIMISAHPAAREEAQEAGADDFLAKPFDANELLTSIKTLVAKKAS